jgi:hypothetical protein
MNGDYFVICKEMFYILEWVLKNRLILKTSTTKNNFILIIKNLISY